MHLKEETGTEGPCCPGLCSDIGRVEIETESRYKLDKTLD